MQGRRKLTSDRVTFLSEEDRHQTLPWFGREEGRAEQDDQPHRIFHLGKGRETPTRDRDISHIAQCTSRRCSDTGDWLRYKNMNRNYRGGSLHGCPFLTLKNNAMSARDEYR